MLKIVLMIAAVFMVGAANGAVITKDGLFVVSGTGEIPISTFSGTTTGVAVDLGTGPLPSGDIGFTLDPSLTSKLTLDFDAEQMTFDFNLLVTFPLQAGIGAPPISIHVVETGPMSPFTLVIGPGPSDFTSVADGEITQLLLPPQSTSGSSSGTFTLPTGGDIATFFFDPTELSGGGSVTSGPFSGFGYDNGWTVTAKVRGEATVPGGTVSGEITISNAPLPGTLVLVATGGLIGISLRRRRRLELKN